jgi:hopanoid-associated phosphorylase
MEDRAQPIIVVVGLAFEARIAAGPNTTVICSGDGRELSANLERAIAAGCRGLLSFGLAGGLAPQLRPGACLVASEIVSPAGRLATHPHWSRNLLKAFPQAVGGPILGHAAPVMAPAVKHDLWQQTGAHAVDMESHIVAQAAATHGLPMVAVRVVADPAHRALPSSALAGMRPDGRTDAIAVLRSLRSQPRELPALIRTALDARAARASLLRGCRLLGPCFGFPDLAELELNMTREHVLGGPLTVERDFGRHGAIGAGAAQSNQ